MPTPPRRRPATPPARRPKVAGLRRPAGPSADENPESPLVEQDDLAATVEPTAADAPTGPTASTAEPVTAEDPTATTHEPDAPLVTDGVLGATPAGPFPDEPAEPSAAAAPVKQAKAPAKAAPAAAAKAPAKPKSKPADAESTPARRPAGKRKSTGSVVSDRREDTRRHDTAPREARPARASTGRPGLNAAIVLAVLALVLAGLALWFKGKSDSLTAGADTDNSAVTDVRSTEELKNKLKSAIERTLSYNYADLGSTAKAVEETLTDRAVCDYNALYGKIKEIAPQEKLVLSTKVRDIGVVSLRGAEAEALVFVDQTTTRAAAAGGAEGQTVASGAQFAVQARQDGDVWKITAFDMLSQPLPGGQSTANC